MNKFTHSLTLKITSIFLFVITVIVFIGGIVGIGFLYEYDFYVTSVDNVKVGIFKSITYRYARSVYWFFISNKENLYEVNIQKDLPIRSTNFFFVLKNSDGKTLLSNYSTRNSCSAGHTISAMQVSQSCRRQ